jgi:hypothetical protein
MTEQENGTNSFRKEQAEAAYSNAEARIEAARRNLSWNIADKVRVRARALGEEYFPTESVKTGERTEEVKLIKIGPFRNALNHQAYIDIQGEIYVARTVVDGDKDILDMDTASLLHELPDFTEQDMLNLDAQASFALRQALEQSSE